VDVAGNKAVVFPDIQDLYPFVAYLTLHFGGETHLLIISPFIFYAIPSISTDSSSPPITSKFGGNEEVWLPVNSSFKFSDNYFYKTIEIYFGYFAQGAKKSEDCTTNCPIHKYQLQAKHSSDTSYSIYSLESEAIIT
jgi:hypothetical protein